MATIVTRSGKGSPLTNNEVDANFTNLNTDKLESGDTAASLTITTTDINGGTIDGTTIGGATPAAGSFTSLGATGNITVGGTVDGRDVAADGTKLDTVETNADVTDTANVTAAGALMDSELTDIAAVKALNQGVATTDSPSFAGLTATTADINGGTIDGVTIGGSSAGAGSFTTLTASGDVNFDSGTFFVDEITNRVGIGTTSPGATLDIIGNHRVYGSGATAVVLLSSSSTLATISSGASSSTALSFETGGTERMRIDSNGKLLVGATSSIATIGSTLQVSGTSTIASSRTTNNAFGSDINFAKSRGGTSIVSSGDNLGNLIWWGANGTGYNTAASIRAEVDGTPGASNDMPGRIVFMTTPDGSGTLAERVRIDSSGRLVFNPANINDNNNSIFSNSNGYMYVEGNTSGLILQTNSGANCRIRIEDNDTIQFQTSSSEAMRIDSSGRLLVGKTSSSFSNEGSELRSDGQIIGTKDGGKILTLNRLTSNGNLAEFYKDDTLVGSIGTSGGLILIGTGSANLLFNDGIGVVPSTSSGAISDNVLDFGSASRRWDDVYATNGTIQTSDANEKQDIEELSEAEHRVAVAAKGLLRKFRWISSVEEKGDDARIHFGIIAQDLKAAFEAEGLDAGRYAMFIHSTWTDEETGEERSRMGVRYSELLAFIIAAL